MKQFDFGPWLSKCFFVVTVAGVSQSVNLRSTEDSNDSDADEKISDEGENNEDNIGTSMMVQGGPKVYLYVDYVGLYPV